MRQDGQVHPYGWHTEGGFHETQTCQVRRQLGVTECTELSQAMSNNLLCCRVTIAELDEWLFAIGGEKEKPGSTQRRLSHHVERFSKTSGKWSKVKSLPFHAR